ncbi:Uncharacterised protein [Enterobacter cloacae]|uniref:Uncharacterized protein n=1 Tax=Enterobacter cloacae TaxID=550 RepID=A0A377LUD3_ENTCL|nr:Uncharacterised protein [Enterobacter cloacae]
MVFSSAAWRERWISAKRLKFSAIFGLGFRVQESAPAARHQKLGQRQFGGRGLRAVDRRLRRHIRGASAFQFASADRVSEHLLCEARCRQTASEYDEPDRWRPGTWAFAFFTLRTQSSSVVLATAKAPAPEPPPCPAQRWLLGLRVTQGVSFSARGAFPGGKMIARAALLRLP